MRCLTTPNHPAARHAAARRFRLALLSLLAAVTGPWMPVGLRAGRAEVPLLSPQRLPRGSPSQRALLQSAFWWTQAVQVANDEYDEGRAALKAWDPEARSGDETELRRLLAGDNGGCLRRASRAARRATALARTPKERHRAARQLARLEGAARCE